MPTRYDSGMARREDFPETWDVVPDGVGGYVAPQSFMSPEELEEMDQGRFMCLDCGEFYAPDGNPEHTGCPSPRRPDDYPPGLLS